MRPHPPLLSLPPPHCRLRIPPFEKARKVLEALQQRRLVRMQEGMRWYLPYPNCVGRARCLQLSSSTSFLGLGSVPFPCSVGDWGGGRELLMNDL